MRRLLLILFCILYFLNTQAQLTPAQTYWQLELERKAEQVKIQDSIHYLQDSLQMVWVKMPDKNRSNQFLDSLKEVYIVRNGDLFAWVNQFKQDQKTLEKGTLKVHRSLWIVFCVGLLILFFSILKYNYSSQLGLMIKAIYSNAAFTQLNKEENIYDRWPFLLLYILFSFIFGLFIYFGAKTYHSSYFYSGISFYLMVSIGVLFYFSLKIAFVKLLGFVFDIQMLAKEYVSILYLSYFNAAIFLLPIVSIFAFSPQEYIDRLFLISSFLLILFFALQFLRASYYTLNTYKFSKFYLFLYFCTLEIGPLLLVIKIIRL